MKKIAILASGLGFAMAGGQAPLSAQAGYGPCYDAYVANTDYCSSDSSCNQRTVDRMYRECLETGIVEYI